MPVEATPQLRVLAVLDNLLGVATTPAQRQRIDARFHELYRPLAIRDSLDPNNLTAAQRSRYMLELLNGQARLLLGSAAHQQETAASADTIAANVATALTDFPFAP